MFQHQFSINGEHHDLRRQQLRAPGRALSWWLRFHIAFRGMFLCHSAVGTTAIGPPIPLLLPLETEEPRGD